MALPIELPTWDEILRGISEAITRPVVESLNHLVSSFYYAVKPVKDAIENLAYQLWVAISRSVTDVAHVLYSYFSPLLSQISLAVNDLAARVTSGVSAALDTVSHVLHEVWSNITRAVQSAVSDLISGVEGLRASISAIPNSIAGLRSALLQWYEFGGRLIAQILRFQMTVHAAVYGAIDAGVRQLVASVTPILSSAVSTISAGWERFLSGFISESHETRVVLQALREDISRVTVNPAEWFIEGILKPVAKHIYSFAKWIWEGIKPYLAEIRDIIHGPIRGFASWFTSIATNLLDLFRPETQAAWSLLMFIRGAVEYEGEATPEKAMEAAANYLSIVMGMSFADAGLTFGENLIQSILGTTIAGTGLGFGKGRAGLGFARLFRNLQFNLGLNWLTWIIFGQMFRAVIADPLERYYRWRYRTTYPTRSEIQEWLRTRLIDEKTAREELRWLGYSDRYIEHVLRSAYREVSFSMWIDMREYGLISDEDLEKAIESLGYPPEVTGLIVHYAKMRVLDERISRLRTRLADAYVDGYYARDAVRTMLIGLGLREEFVDWFLSSYDIDHDIEIRKLTEKALFEAYERGKISEDELRARLSEIIADPKILELKILYKKLQLMPKERYDYLLTLEDRKRRAEFKIKSLELQIKYLMDRRKENAEYYQARINLLIERYDDRIIKLRKQLDEAVAKIEERYKHIFTALEDEFANYGDKPVEQLTERIMQLRKQLETARGLRAEVLEAKITLLTELSRVPLADRPAVFEAVMGYYRQQMRSEINSVKAEYEQKIKEIEEERDARIRVLQEQMEKTDKYFEERISKLAVQLEEAKADLDVIEKLIEMKVSS